MYWSVSFAMQKFFDFMRSQRSSVDVNSWTIKPFRKDLPVLISSHIFPTFFIHCFQSLGSYIKVFDTFVQSDFLYKVKVRGLASSFCMCFPGFLSTICGIGCVSLLHNFCHLYKNRWLCLHGFIAESYVLSHWSVSIYVPVVGRFCYYSLKSDMVLPSALFFLIKVALDIQNLFWFLIDFIIVFCISLMNGSGNLVVIALNLQIENKNLLQGLWDRRGGRNFCVCIWV